MMMAIRSQKHTYISSEELTNNPTNQMPFSPTFLLLCGSKIRKNREEVQRSRSNVKRENNDKA